MKNPDNLAKLTLGGAAVSLAATQVAEAQVTINDITSFSNAFTMVQTGVSNSHQWDVDGDGDNDFVFNYLHTSSSPGFSIRASAFNDGNADFLRNTVGRTIDFRGLNTTMSVGASAPNANFFWGVNLAHFQNSMNGEVAATLQLGLNYIGFQFLNDSGTTLYGWASVTITSPTNNYDMTLTVNNWAYNINGDAIRVGDVGTAIPEPSEAAMGLGLLALGAIGVSRYRQRRKIAESKS